MWLWMLVIILIFIGFLLCWWLFKTGRLKGKLFYILFFIYLPLYTIVPFLKQPRGQGSLFLYIGIILISLGALIGLMAWMEFHRHKASLIPDGWVPKELVTTGIYHFIRHPMYLGYILICIGWYSIWKALYALYLITPLIIIGVWLRAYLEEHYILERKFGKIYRKYQKKTGMLLPLLTLLKKWNNKPSLLAAED